MDVGGRASETGALRTKELGGGVLQHDEVDFIVAVVAVQVELGIALTAVTHTFAPGEGD